MPVLEGFSFFRVYIIFSLHRSPTSNPRALCGQQIQFNSIQSIAIKLFENLNPSLLTQYGY